jgi:hypothetical protein
LRSFLVAGKGRPGKLSGKDGRTFLLFPFHALSPQTSSHLLKLLLISSNFFSSPQTSFHLLKLLHIFSNFFSSLQPPSHFNLNT